MTPTPTELAETPPVEPPAPAAVRRRRSSDDPLFDVGEIGADDGIMRANWAMPWSDLMMIMFVLFAALLAVQAMKSRETPKPDATKATAAAQPLVVEHETTVNEGVLSRKPSFEPLMQINVLARSEEAMREANLQNAEIVLLEDQSVKVSVQGPMFFALGRADLRPEVTNFLDRLARIIKQTPYDIHVVGHTDDRPIATPQFPSNWELSLFRASAVARYLIKSGNLEPSRFLVMGRGEYEPATMNEDPQSRALNRRVEIIITRVVGKAQGENRQ